MRTTLWVLFLGAVVRLAAQDSEQDSPLLRWMDRIAQQQLDTRSAEIEGVRTVDAAEQRKQKVRAKILELIGGLPDYPGPLNAKVTGRIETPKYIIEKVLF